MVNGEPNMVVGAGWKVRRVPEPKREQAMEFVRTFHYSSNCKTGVRLYGLYLANTLAGVSAFGNPVQEPPKAQVFGVEYKTHVTELHRLAIHPAMPKHSASWFIPPSTGSAQTGLSGLLGRALIR